MSIKKLIALPLYAILFLPLIGLASCGQGASSAGGAGVQIDWVNFNLHCKLPVIIVFRLHLIE